MVWPYFYIWQLINEFALFVFHPPIMLFFLASAVIPGLQNFYSLLVTFVVVSLELELQEVEEKQDDENVGFYFLVLYDQQSLHISWPRNR